MEPHGALVGTRLMSYYSYVESLVCSTKGLMSTVSFMNHADTRTIEACVCLFVIEKKLAMKHHLLNWSYYKLTGRAVVELTIKKGDDEVGGEPRKTAFRYVKPDIVRRSELFIHPEVAADNHFPITVYSHSFYPSWKDGELPVLPLSVYGAVAMAHSDVSEEYSSPYQIFFYLYGIEDQIRQMRDSTTDKNQRCHQIRQAS
ncbi:hypothetical protein V6N11_019364 [Hibiscus sabdariffa]|uniref:Uncharacterized protein n=1 Tax=Hibiscus sabdariffa TaxID=183260 RepID=A0ABR2R274_9ROSI